MKKERFQGLELLATAVVVSNQDGLVLYANLSAETLLEVSMRSLDGQAFPALFVEAQAFRDLLRKSLADPFGVKRQVFELIRPSGASEHVHVTLSCPDGANGFTLIELREIEQQLKVDREARMLDQSLANKELIRNLAHEIKNPLGGIRGAAQLLEVELPSPDLKEYTQVIIKESDRLQTLVDRLLAPHRKPHIVSMMNIHEVCERVRSVILAEHPKGLKFVRDYDISIPEFLGDLEQLIQAILNIVRNAAQALAPQIEEGTAKITLCTRVVRRVTVNRKQHRLALDLQVIDNGPGVPVEIMERIFFPLVSGREGGSGLGLTLAQTFVQQHEGIIECSSTPGKTIFKVTLPLQFDHATN
ncbi:nitrogen specific signal transduction histidine kinase NtrB [Limnobacter thiooxidans]|uniref:histidine kinase n=1 Tax=Limnobacter thiooxidans TaxID=131080 RepID=A0AA86J0J9_9BURK|nr:nitrogen regulation protein NR(II) [Limnobacter sp.]MCZ8015643.1 nitrogen regulation protein NR(II) [Limnobacter sp.]RZS42728.1 nitrogen specific signal transduction histidine kinase NtrB [Limnobacter thiooxidans]BET25838.1 nitrogen regulation protein NR(II) [Limnobacter thiooxidans]